MVFLGVNRALKKSSPNAQLGTITIMEFSAANTLQNIVVFFFTIIVFEIKSDIPLALFSLRFLVCTSVFIYSLYLLF